MPKRLNGKPPTNKKSKAFSKIKMDLAATDIADNIVFSKDSSYAYYRLTNYSYDFLHDEQKKQLGWELTKAFSAIMNDRQKPLECHLIIDAVPVDVDAWVIHNLNATEWTTPSSFEQFIEEEGRYLRQNEFLRREVYLGVKLTDRNAIELGANDFEAGFMGAVQKVKELSTSFLRTHNGEVTAQEEAATRAKEVELYNTVSSGALQAQRANTEELLLLIKRQFYPAMPSPYLDVDHDSRIGAGDIELETGHALWNKMRFMAISQMIGEHEVTGYRACLTLSKFPKARYVPYSTPFFQFTDLFSFPIPMYARFVFHPVSKMQSEVEKKKREAKDQVENYAVAADSMEQTLSGGGLPPHLEETLSDMNSIQEITNTDKSPWIEGSYHLVVEAPSESDLKRLCAQIKQAFSTHLDINVTWSSGDQAKLFLEQMPGDRRRVSSFDQTTNVAQIGTSGFNYSPSVGDRILPLDQLKAQY